MNRTVPPSHHRRAGLTLTELLVVIAILVVVTSVLAPLITPSLEGREVREAARQINAYFQQAQAKAKQLGRPVGVVIQRSPNVDQLDQDYGYQLSLAEQPPSFKGFNATETATLDVNLTDSTLRTTFANGGKNAGTAKIFTSSPDAFVRLVQPNDRIRFNFRGPKYPIASVQIQSGSQPQPVVITFEVDPADRSKYVIGNAVKFEVFRRPRMSSSTPLEMPVGTAMVMDLSGVGLNYLPTTTTNLAKLGVESPYAVNPRQAYIGLTEFRRLHKEELLPTVLSDDVFAELAKLPLTIMFAPDGKIDRVYRVLPPFAVAGLNLASLPPKRPQDKIFLFVGKDGLKTGENFATANNLWITIDPQSGLVTSAPHIPDVLPDSKEYPTPQQIAVSRQIAATGQSMGGQ